MQIENLSYITRILKIAVVYKKILEQKRTKKMLKCFFEEEKNKKKFYF